MKGLRTFILAGLLAVAPAATTYFGNVDWVTLLQGLGIDPKWAVPLATVISGALMAYMRSITNTPPAQK